MLAYACSIIRVHLKSKLHNITWSFRTPLKIRMKWRAQVLFVPFFWGDEVISFSWVLKNTYMKQVLFTACSMDSLKSRSLEALRFPWSTGQPFFSSNDPSTVAAKEHNPIRRWTRNQVPATSPCNVTKQLPTRRINFLLMNFDHRNHAGVLNHTRVSSRFLASWV